MCQRADRAEAERATGSSQKAAGPNDGVYGTLLEFMGIVSESTLAGSTGYANQAGGANNQRMNLAQSWVIAAETSPRSGVGPASRDASDAGDQAITDGIPIALPPDEKRPARAAAPLLP